MQKQQFVYLQNSHGGTELQGPFVQSRISANPGLTPYVLLRVNPGNAASNAMQLLRGCPDYWAIAVDLSVPTQAPQSEVWDDKKSNSDPVGTIQVAKVQKIPQISPPFPVVGVTID